jgi:hypothetical protein
VKVRAGAVRTLAGTVRALTGAVAVLAAAGCGGAAPRAEQAAPPPVAKVQTASTALTGATLAPKPKPKPKPKPRPKPDPGTLPQTDQRPSSDTPAFKHEMSALWAGVRANSLVRALPAFFPEAAYVQVKAIGDAQGDYTGRLLGDYRLDLAAAHALLGGDPGSARLVGVMLPPSSAHWVGPGVCYNRVGYYEWPNARLVYRQHGTVHSFGIASMISWRGVWYVIHLGAVVRASAIGLVDDPSSGVGSSIPSSTC